MDVETAFRVLGLSENASVDEIESRYRTLARQRHPDSGGADDTMRELNLARDLAKAAATSAVVPLSVATELVAAAVAAVESRVAGHYEARESTERAKKHATFTVRRVRHIALLLGAYAAVFLFIGKDLPPEIAGGIFGQEAKGLTSLAFWVGSFAALLGGAATIFIQTTEHRIEELTQRLSTKPAVAELWSEIVSPSTEKVTREQLLERCVTWSDFLQPDATNRSLRWLARRMGCLEFAHLLLSKGGEVGAIVRIHSTETGRQVERYHLDLATVK